jgi:ribosomal protein S18 acetylase RimI-like enzyme
LTTADVDPAVIEMFDSNIVEFYVHARSRPWADIRIDDDVAWGSTGLPLQAFNGAVAATFSDETADARIEMILDYFRELKVDMSWWVGPTSPSWLGDRLVAHGLALDYVAPGMAVSLDGWSAPPIPDGIEIEHCRDAASFHEAIDVMFEGFEMPRDIQPLFEERFLGYSVGPRPINRTYLARIEGRPVATSLGLLLHDVLGIYNVATVPAARGRGAGGAVTAAAMVDARTDGARWAILESSPMGRSVYERLGFREVTQVAVYGGSFSGSAAAGHG